jgi:uncharacterized protein (TIGR03545 family)
MKVFRWKAVVPLCLFLALVAAIWLLLLDGLVRRGIEEAGAQITGARVDVAEADLSLLSGRLFLRGIEAADPDAPMTNMVELGEVVADIRVAPLLRKKVIIDTVAVRDVRFGTPRTESGELPDKGRTTGAVARRLSSWVGRYTVPELSLEGLGEAVDVSDLSVDSLTTVGLARSIPLAADSLLASIESRIRSVDAQAGIDSARALATRLKGATLRSLGLSGLRDALNSGRNVLRELDEQAGIVTTLRTETGEGVSGIRSRLAGLDEARTLDYDRARSLLRIPSLEAPDIGPSLFGEMAQESLAPYLKWLDKVEELVPGGLMNRESEGPKRTRNAGRTVHFPRRGELPRFLLGYGEISLDLGDPADPRRYRLELENVTSDPAVHGQPMRITLDRWVGGVDRVEGIRAAAIVDRTTAEPSDQIEVEMTGHRLPDVPMRSLRGTLRLGSGSQTLLISRRGGQIDARLSWQAPAVTWESDGERTGLDLFVWETISGLERVEADLRLFGTLESPDLTVRSNVASELAEGLQRRLGDEVARAERRVRAEVDRHVEPAIEEARARVASLQTEVEERVTELESRFQEARAELDKQIKDLTRRIGGGIIPPLGRARSLAG